MNLSRTMVIDLPAETVWSMVQTARLLSHIAWPLLRFVPVGGRPLEDFHLGGRYEVKLRLLGVLPLGTQWIVISLHEPETGAWPKRLHDDGYSVFIRRWDHWITVAPDGPGRTRYSDDVEVSAGMLTPVIWMFAQVFFFHRQRRWRALARTLNARGAVADDPRL